VKKGSDQNAKEKFNETPSKNIPQPIYKNIECYSLPYTAHIQQKENEREVKQEPKIKIVWIIFLD
jgi:hypothetical protein